MLFGYPISATHENWLHDCLMYAIERMHSKVEAGETLGDIMLIIPNECAAQLQHRPALRERMLDYFNELYGLDREGRQLALAALMSENDIEHLLAGTVDCVDATGLPDRLYRNARSLFDFAFGLLTDLGIRDRQYATICDVNVDDVCPFCGIETFDAPGAPRGPLDHYLA